MKIEEKFNRRSANLVKVSMPIIHSGPQYAEGLKLTFLRPSDTNDFTTIAMHMTPAEAIELAESLLNVARGLMIEDPRLFNRTN